ncbi:hypothetical protein SK571_24050 [Lentzea sp. BCCO 10_0798]|uniref:Glycosyl hydrolase catalytic core n=1 Tax=Lentzea kristufekii TaxID=3095430 RepID=A0ABU4TX60_9PSEU|nr:hypothetical protein [Lentzea sp. BCCO 10_0798]MDX8052467.1 hypothetical protein [Lentzea sp. BCCO 10_0798]
MSGERQYSRRAIGKLAAGAVAAAGMASLPGRASAAPHYRAHGPLLTDGYQTWIDAINNQGANLAKVVTGWGMPGSGPWQNFPDHIWTAAGATNFLIVRTVTGDTDRMIDPNQAVAEIRDSRFFEFKRIRSGADKCIIELGNEPNIRVADPWAYGYNLSVTIDRIRETFPGAKICGTALSPNKTTNPDTWYANPNFVDAIKKCDFVGVHFYSNADDGDFGAQGGWNELTYSETLSRCAQKWPGKPVIATEYSMRTTKLTPYQKGYKYGNFLHFDDSVASSLWGACYYHVQTNPGGIDFHENVGSEGARGYRKRLSEGGL